MFAVWSWLRELCDFGRAVSVDEAAQAFTDAGLEVEAITKLGDFSGVVVAEVVGKRPHPNADRLTLVDVITEPGGTKTEVVCGAPNVPEPGGLVLWAPPGAVLPGGFELGQKTIKGVTSAGMLCAEDELGLGDDHAGIIVLSKADVMHGDGPLLGDPEALARLGLIDTSFEVGVHANRPDCLGHLGLARELCALLGGKVRPVAPELTPYLDDSLKAEELATVAIADPIGCPRYTGRVIDGLTVGPSPRWLQQRLRAIDVRPISNLVDITNYVMFELGQPLHAFDYNDVAGHHIEVRRARAGERMTTLDDVERTLVADDLLICDGERPVALAGVMGGANSEVSSATQRVLLESANFEPLTVRRTARRLGLHSQASHRFERGVDPNVADLASMRAAELMARFGGGRIAVGCVDAYPSRKEPWQVSMRASRASQLTGLEFSRDQASALLGRVGLAVENDPADDDRVQVTCPTYRPDLTREVDLIEEVVRIHGVHRVPATLPERAVPRTQVVDDRPRRARHALMAAGMCEAITYGFTSRERIDALELPEGDRRRAVVSLKNPMSVAQAVMRTSLLPNLLGAVAHNISFGIADVGLFEVGSVFLANEPGTLPDEPVHIAGVLTGTRSGWLRDGGEVDFFDIKGAVERLCAALRLDDAQFVATRDVPYLHPGVCAAVYAPGAPGAPDGAPIGHVGEVHPRVRERFGIEQTCFAFDVALAGFPVLAPAQMRPIAKYPAITRDISIFVDVDMPAARVRALIDACEQPLIERVAILEDYRDPDKVPAGKKGLLWTITYRSTAGTLTDTEVDSSHEAIVGRLIDELPAERR